MTVYIITEDNFFSFGLETRLKSSGHSFLKIDSSAFETILQKEPDNEINTIYIMHLATSNMNLAMLLARKWLPPKLLVLVPKNYYHFITDTLKMKFIIDNIDTQDNLASILNKTMLETRSFFSPNIHLTNMEKIVLKRILTGQSINNISRIYKISNKTTYHHKKSALNKLGVINKSDLALAEKTMRTHLTDNTDYKVRYKNDF
ncbi:helix-turn-helix transcriptional regulator [Serratia proteamaculans]|uniref:helix-turn-helix domain-containing protein n=1 Tax=Serratia proteamaculans TaxID=28151 RepID=UPI0010765B41|nr:LuxR C-terminal-related transcriptional regulator [Serratia proteamaculans]TFZ52674.1 helix-turn-helix transcriptional regulator [Serratia proteamaculans]